MKYTIHTKGTPKVVESDFRQFEGYVGSFDNLDDALKGARYLSNSRRLPLGRFEIVDKNDVSRRIVTDIQPGKGAYIYGAHMS